MAAAGAFVIVDGVADARRPLRLWRLPVVLVGLLLVPVGILGLVPLTFVVGATVLSLRLGDDPELLGDAELWLWVVGLFVGGYVVLRVGVRLLRGQRRSVLFLRRFGFTDATRVLSGAVSRGLGRRWRLITLDDLRVVPVGLGRRRRLARAGPWLLLALLLFLLLAVLPGWFESELEQSMDEAVASAEAEGKGPLEALFAAFFTALIVVMLLLFVAVTPVAIGGALVLFGFGASVAVRRAEGRRAVQIDRPGQVDRVARKVERATSRIYSPRLTVVRCANEVWQAVVHRFADLTDATLIDVSEASPGLLWELTELGPERAATWVLVGRRDRLEAVLTDPSPDALRLRTLLDGQTVLAYRPEDPGRFEDALRARLTHVR